MEINTDTYLIKQLHQTETQDCQVSIIESLSEKAQNDIRDCAKKSSLDCIMNRGNVLELADDIISNLKGRPAVVHYGLDWDELDYVPVPGKCIFTYGSWVSRVIESATCLDIALIADDAIVATGDYEFRWLEDIYEVGITQTGIPVYELGMDT
jgi:hypothetical protein